MALRVSCAGLLVALALSCRPPAERGKTGGPGFSVKPTARLEGKAVVIEFAVAEATDVAVFVKDRRGRTVRHLAAGVLGSKAPAPLAAGKLAQRLVWDGRDDQGRAVSGGKYRVEVALGLEARYSGSFGWNPRALGRVHGLAVGPGGDLYVMSGVGRDSGDGRFQVFSARGKYKRTILPRPGDLPLARAKPLGELVLDGGERFPTALLPQYGSRMYQVPAVAPNGDLIFLNGPRRGKHPEGKRFQSVAHDQDWPRRLLRLASDGGAPEAGYLGPVLGKGFERKPAYLALAPDGETIYVSGARHAVFRVKWGKDEKPAVFIGTPDKAGSGKDGLKDPCGIAFDAAGNLYVADRGNHRIACFDKTGKLLDEIRVEWPRQLVVHPQTRVIYAACGYKSYRLLKFAGMDAPRPSAEMPLRSAWPFLALDARGSRAVIYVANLDRRDAAARKRWMALVRLVDTGKELKETTEISDRSGPLQPILLGVDRGRELVYGQRGIFTEYARWDGRTGRAQRVPIPLHPKANGISEITAGADGTVAVHVQSEFGRLDHKLQPLPFEASGTFITRLFGDDCPRSFYDRGSCVAPDGGIYRVHERGGYSRPMRVSAINADGTVRKDSLVVFDTRAPAAVRVDRAGNIYVLDHLKPVGQPVPQALEGKVPVRRHNPFIYNYGSIVKFGPGGGRIKEISRKAPVKRPMKRGEIQFTTAEGRGDFVSQGALWSYYGVSMIQPALGRGGYCMCSHPRFDIDDFARVFVPDQLRCRIVVLDTNGNVITTIGRYGNVDDRGPGVPLADPRTVMVSRRAVYVGDMTNNRVVRAELAYRVRAACAVEVPGRSLSELAEEFAKKRLLLERRQTLKLINAQIRVRDVRAEALKLSPSLERKLDWKALESRLVRRTTRALPNADDARAVLCMTAPREAAGWPQEEARELLGAYLAQGGEGVRAAVAWGLCGGRLEGLGEELLLRALRDKSQRVRVTAAYALLDRGEAAGLAEIFRGAASENPDIYKLAETAILKKLIVWDEFHPQARLIDPSKCRVPAYPADAPAVKALSALLLRITTADTRDLKGGKQRYWFLRERSIYLLGLSGRAEAAGPLLAALRLEKKNAWGRNRNRLIASLGLHRVRRAVPDILEFLERGRGSAYLLERGDKAESYAATALVRIGEPESVKPIIALLAVKKPEVRLLARRTLSRMFDAEIPDDRCLVPKGGKLVRVRVDGLPQPADLRAAWGSFWQTSTGKYEWNPKAAPLRLKGRK